MACPKDEPTGGSKYSSKFSALDAEVTFQSSDHVLFKIHQKELSITSGGFDPPPNADFQEVVGLPEDEETLELLFQFVYPSMTPDISTISFSLLDRLCEAAHKYQVYSAMDLCSLYMNEAVVEQPMEVFRFSVRHGYRDIASRAAPLVIDEPLDSIVEKVAFSLTETLHWLRYYRSWTDCQKAAITNLGPKRSMEYRDYQSIIEKLCSELRSLQNLDSVFLSSSSSEGKEWKGRISLAVASIPKFFDLFYDVGEEKPDMDGNQATNQGPTTPVFYKSLDNVVLSSDRQWVRAFSPGLFEAALAATSVDCPALVSETGMVLKDLLLYVSPCKKPDSLDWGLSYLGEMADAAEKYKILPAMRVCQFHMRKNLRSHPASVFRYGVVHNYPELMDPAAPLVLSPGPSHIASMLPKEFILSWINYHERWSETVRNAVNKPELLDFFEVSSEIDRDPKKRTQTYKECRHCYNVFDVTEILCEFAKGPQALLRLDKIVDPSKACCEDRKKVIGGWKTNVQSDIDAIAPFSSFLA